MKSDGTERPEPQPDWTDYEELEKILAGEESKQYKTSRSIGIAKCILFLCMILFPAAYIGSCVNAEQSYRRPGRDYSPKPPELPPRPADAPKYEQPVLDLVKPAMLEKHALKDFDVMYLESGLRIRIRTDETLSPRMSRAFGIMEDIRTMRRTVPGLPACAWVLEIDHEAMDGGMTFVLPDAKRGYRAFPEWHENALYTATPAPAERARP